MNKLKIALIFCACSLATGCYASTAEDGEAAEVAATEQALDVKKTGSLTRKQGGLAAITNEVDRRTDTQGYYDSVLIGADGASDTDIKAGLPTLNAFIARYFTVPEVVAYYYNRGDLGIGREMHCVDKLVSTGEIACYVRNFAAGDDGSEFTFGMSSNIAFKNQDANHPFATVAMVYRDRAVQPAPAGNKVFFVVFNGAGARVDEATLDRTGILFFSGANKTSTPGVNFNNHIPSNCASCHGGNYNNAGKFLPGALFLPFDLDQFEYQNVGGRTRNDQLAAFRRLNEMVWKVAFRSAYVPLQSNPSAALAAANASPVKKQLDGWYNNTVFQPDPGNCPGCAEVFETSNFNSAFVPGSSFAPPPPPPPAAPETPWTSFSSLYQSVVRPMCRNCHITNSLPFNTETQFRNAASTAVARLCTYEMPHALQSVREFWLSTRPAALESYLRSIGKTAEANQLHGCGPGNVATLDPQHIAATVLADLDP